MAQTSSADVIGFGHAHRPYAKRAGGVWFVNVGSVGKPKDGDPRACYVLMDTSRPEDVEFVRVPYPVDIMAHAIRTSELPDEFAKDIETGGHPERV